MISGMSLMHLLLSPRKALAVSGSQALDESLSTDARALFYRNRYALGSQLRQNGALSLLYVTQSTNEIAIGYQNLDSCERCLLSTASSISGEICPRDPDRLCQRSQPGKFHIHVKVPNQVFVEGVCGHSDVNRGLITVLCMSVLRASKLHVVTPLHPATDAH